MLHDKSPATETMNTRRCESTGECQEPSSFTKSNADFVVQGRKRRIYPRLMAREAFIRLVCHTMGRDHVLYEAPMIAMSLLMLRRWMRLRLHRRHQRVSFRYILQADSTIDQDLFLSSVKFEPSHSHVSRWFSKWELYL